MSYSQFIMACILHLWGLIYIQTFWHASSKAKKQTNTGEEEEQEFQ